MGGISPPPDSDREGPMKKHISTIVLILVFLVGLSVLLYPTISDFYNSRVQSRAIYSYSQQVSEIDRTEYEAIFRRAHEYNERILNKTDRYALTADEMKDYLTQLRINEDITVMGYLEIPVITVRLPIYHGTDESVLQIGVGHLEGSSLPIGGESTHTVISGHRALPTATLLSNLDKVVVGDVFSFSIMDEKYTYEVDQIKVVDPDDFTYLNIVRGEEYATMITCTPYGINSHRLLVRGHRVDNEKEALQLRISADAIQIDEMLVAPLIAAPIVIVMLLYILIKYRKRGERS